MGPEINNFSPNTHTHPHILTKHRMEPQVINTINSKLNSKAMRIITGDDAASV
jgi:hypothetical protein